MSQMREARRVFANHLNHPSLSNIGPLSQGHEEEPFREQIQAFVSKTALWPRQSMIGLLLVIGLLAFEVFNFDTTQYALLSLLGEVSFLGFRWATILAVAFGAIDFAGLAYLLAPERDQGSQSEVWYLMGAWLLGASMNALMTWWAVSLTLLNHDLGNEVLGRAQLIEMVPVFVAVLVWLTRILFIGAFSIAGSKIFGINRNRERLPVQSALPRPLQGKAGNVVLSKRHGLQPNRPGPGRAPYSVVEEDEPFSSLEQDVGYHNTPFPDRRQQPAKGHEPLPASRRPLPMAAKGRVRRRRIVT